jgi:carboxymethylenebutenolidase
VRDNTALSRFELDADGETAVAFYRLSPGVITFTHTEVAPGLRGRDVGSALIRGGLEAARARGLRWCRAAVSCQPISHGIRNLRIWCISTAMDFAAGAPSREAGRRSSARGAAGADQDQGLRSLAHFAATPFRLEPSSNQDEEHSMPGEFVKITSRAGGAFDCYLSVPAASGKVPAIVLASAVHGVDKDIRDLADEFASHGYIAAAPELFWRTIPGPLGHDDERTKVRSQPRLEKIKKGEPDLVDTLTELRKLPQSNGRAAVIGFCYGGPYAILGPKRLGFDAGISCHGSRMGDYIAELDGVTAPVCIVWGDQDHGASADVLAAYRDVPSRMKNVEVHIIPGVLHGYMMPGIPKAFHQATRDLSMARTLAILGGLRDDRLRQAS